MSWNFEFYAATPESAKAELAGAYAPDSIKAMVSAAIESLPETEGVVHAKTYGHLADASNRGSSGIQCFTVEKIRVAP